MKRLGFMMDNENQIANFTGRNLFLCTFSIVFYNSSLAPHPCIIRSKTATHSVLKLPPIPGQSCHHSG